MLARKWTRTILILGVLLGWLMPWLSQGVALAAVGLMSFHAEGLDGEVIVDWQTGSELSNAGFFVQRSLAQNGSFTRISPFIPADGTSISGAYYIYSDTSVTNGTTYWYRLESIDLNNQSDYFDPVAATPQAETTPTLTLAPTETATQAATLTRTPTLISTPTQTVAPGYPAPPTSTPQPSTTPAIRAATATGTVQATLFEPASLITATVTLVPLPELTLQFPGDAVALAVGQAPLPSPFLVQSDENPGASRRWLIIGIIVAVWAGLGIWFFISMRKIQ